MLFDRKWFERWQWLLLLTLNLWIVGRFARRFFAIDGDIPTSGKVTRVFPHGFLWLGKEGRRCFDFRTHDKLAKRLWFGLAPLWRAAHWWDMKIANRLCPALNLGCDSYGPYYPQAGGGGANVTHDGYLKYDDEYDSMTWAQVIAQSSASEFDCASTTANVAAYCVYDESYEADKRTCGRLQFTIKVDVPSGATVTDGTVSFRGHSKAATGCASATAKLYNADPASNGNIAAADYGDCGTTAQSSTAITYSGWSTSGYNDYALNSTGVAAVQAAIDGGILKLCLRESYHDVAGNDVASEEYFIVTARMADYTGTDDDPKLTGTYTGGSLPWSMFGGD